MSYFLEQAWSDIRAGRETWRVVVTFSLGAFVAAVAMRLAF
jgi:hypothetical protein